MNFELSNEQRIYFGLEPIKPNWDRVNLKGDTYRKESVLFFEGDVLKKHIFPYDDNYKELQYNLNTRLETASIYYQKRIKEKSAKLQLQF